MIDLYFYENSVCSERVLMTLAEKEFGEWTGHPIDLFAGEQANPEYLELNPKGQVPTLVHNGQIIRESSIICDYLDRIIPEKPLKPVSAYDLAQMQEWVKEADESGFQGVGALTFTTVFREKLLAMPVFERQALWDKQTDLARTYRQKSCVTDGFNSPYAIIALGAWEHIFGRLEARFKSNQKWIMGDKLTLADINFAPLIARLEAIQLLCIWLEQRPATRAWWNRLKSRQSFIQAKVGPGGGEENEIFAKEGKKAVGKVRAILHRTSSLESIDVR
jgi:glutathione S-transferase